MKQFAIIACLSAAVHQHNYAADYGGRTGSQEQPLAESWHPFREQQQQEGPTVLEQAEFQKKVLGAVEGQGDQIKKVGEKVEGIGGEFKRVDGEIEKITLAFDEVKKSALEFQKWRISQPRPVKPGHVSDDVARAIASFQILDGVQRGKFTESRQRDIATGIFKDITGLECKAALTTSDIPMPTGYSGEITELVYKYGQARQFGTVFPLPNGTFKIPKLGTDTTFGLLAVSGTVTEKSPTISFVTFTAEKFGGLVRLPSEIDEDSVVPMGQFLARYCARQMAQAEDYNFFRSTGAASGVNGTATGLTKSVVDDSCVWNQGGTTNGGKTKASQATLDDFRQLRSSSTLSGVVLQDACYYMHPTYEALLVSFNTSATVVPYQRGQGGVGASLDGFPIRWINTMPVFSTSAAVSTCHVLFGDVSYNYLGVRGAMRFDTSMDAAFTTDEILVRALERFTIGKMATTAVAGLVTDAS